MSDEPEMPTESADDESAKKASKPKKEKKPKKPKEPKEPKKPKEPKPPKSPKDPSAKKGFPFVFAVIPVALIVASVLAFFLPPTHALLVRSPLGPLIARFDHTSPKTIAAATKPSASAEPAKPPDATPSTAPAPAPVQSPNAGGVSKSNAPTLGSKSAGAPAGANHSRDTLASDRQTVAQKDAQIDKLKAQLTQLRAAASPAPAAAGPSPSPTPVSEEVKRAATYWAGMDADKAAAIVKQLPESYVKLVFSQMPADAVSDIMSELPAQTAARLTSSAAATPP
jgi:hypothetical protein